MGPAAGRIALLFKAFDTPFGAEAVHEVHDVEDFGMGHLGRLHEAGRDGVAACTNLVL